MSRSRRHILVLLAILVLCTCVPAFCDAAGKSVAKTGPLLRMLMHADAESRRSLSQGLGIGGNTPDEVSVVIDYSGDPSALKAAGATVHVVPGSLTTARIPVGRLAAVSALPGIKYVEAARRIYPALDISMPETGASALRTGTPPQWTGYTGKGVVIGMVDTGIDINHLDFRDSQGKSRVLYVWDQSTGTSGANHPSPYTYGTEWTKAQIDAGQCLERDYGSHGSIVMGIAAGNGAATGNGHPAYRYVGMAPEADIIVVKTDFSTPGIIDGMNYIKSRANSLGKPFVINLSLATQFGAHDGTDSMERAIDQISGQGAVVCVASGNDGSTTNFLHADWTTATNGSTATANMNVAGGRDSPFYVDMWYEGNDSIEITVRSPNGYSVTKATGYATANYFSTPDGGIMIDNSSEGINPYNDDHECVIAVQNALAGTWSVTARGTNIRAGGHCDAWIERDQGVNWSTYGSNTQLVAIPGTSNTCITIGGYVTKGTWYNPDGTLQGGMIDFGSRATYSCPGPTRDGRQKPDISAPCSVIASALSINFTPNPMYVVEDGVHRVMGGTSTAAPHASGAAALMLEKDGTLAAEDVKSYLIASARIDSHTGTVWNPSWGHGKLDIATGMQLLPTTMTLSSARQQPHGTAVRLDGQVVTAGLNSLSDRFYIEETDRSCGIQVRTGVGSGIAAEEGSKLTITGTVDEVDGERAILNPSVTPAGSGTVPEPLGIVHRYLGGASVGPNSGVTDGLGQNNVGLLVTIWGKVTYVGSDHFYIDDGSRVDDGSGHLGVKVMCDSLTRPNSTNWVKATGISAIELSGTTSHSILRARKQADLVYY